jgi:SAM-dependent methyltransferase
MPRGSLDQWPADYERARPGWPSGVMDVAQLPPAASVLELGAGTGKLTRLLVGPASRVVAVEPAHAMRQLLARICPQADVMAGTAQAIPLADASVDAVFAAEAFHWFDDKAALAEIARVLRPRSALVLMWNLPAEPWEPSVASVEEFLAGLRPRPDEVAYPLDLGGPRYVSGEWRLAFAGSPFEELHSARLPNPQALDRDGLVAFFASMGWIADMPDQVRLPLLEKVSSSLTAPEYRRLWETHLYWTRLLAS